MKKFIIALSSAAVLSISPAMAAEGFAAENTIQQEANAGWVLQGGKWYFYDQATGQPVTGWLKDQNKWYYLDQTGVMVTGWKMVSGKWYYMNKHGAMQTGWLLDAGKWYYLHSSGAMAKGWVEDGGQHYYMDGTGAMITGWKYIGIQWFHFENSGARSSGWKFLDGNWYFFDQVSGVMMAENFSEGYYLQKNGTMSTAGSKEIVDTVKSLKDKLKMEMSQKALKQVLGDKYTAGKDGHGGEYWRYSLKVTKTGQFDAFVSDEDMYRELGSKKSSIVVHVYWNDGKAEAIIIHYFDAAHKFHVFTHLKYDRVYN